MADTEFRRRLEEAHQVGQDRQDAIDKGVDISLASSWPPGSRMMFWSNDFFGLGLVVANNGNRIRVIWMEGASEPFMEYECKFLSPAVVHKVL